MIGPIIDDQSGNTKEFKLSEYIIGDIGLSHLQRILTAGSGIGTLSIARHG